MHMLIGKLKPDFSTCRNCLNIQMEYDQEEDCTKCSINNKECQIISTGSSFWSGDYVVVLVDGEMKKVSMSRLYDIKEKNKC